MKFWESIRELLLSSGGQLPPDASMPLLVFAVSAAIMGATVMLLDRITYALLGKSILVGVTYTGWSATTRMFLLWGIGAGIGGFLGVAGEVLETGRTACLTAGAAWPLILPRLIAGVPDDEQGDES